VTAGGEEERTGVLEHIKEQVRPLGTCTPAARRPLRALRRCHATTPRAARGPDHPPPDACGVTSSHTPHR